MEPWKYVVIGLCIFAAILIVIDLYRGLGPYERPFFIRLLTGVLWLCVLVILSFIDYDEFAGALIYLVGIAFLLGLLYYLQLRRKRIKDDERLESLAKVDYVVDEVK